MTATAENLTTPAVDTNVAPLHKEKTASMQALELDPQSYSRNLQTLLVNLTQKVKLALPDNDRPETCWDISMRLASKGAPLSEVEFRVFAGRVNGILVTMFKRGDVYRTPKQTMASTKDLMGFGVAKRSSYGYAHKVSSHIRPGPNADHNPAKDAKVEAERRNKVVENQTANMEEVKCRVLDLIVGLRYHDLKAIRDLVDVAMDDAHNALIIEATHTRGISAEKFKELKGMLENQQKALEELSMS